MIYAYQNWIPKSKRRLLWAIHAGRERGRKSKNWSSSYKGLSAKSLQLVLRQSGKSNREEPVHSQAKMK